MRFIILDLGASQANAVARLKYAYLLFSDDDKVPLDKWTFNTEAHPLPTFTWSAWETAHLGIN